jgi:hypothetical protein
MKKSIGTSNTKARNSSKRSLKRNLNRVAVILK